MGMVPGGRTTPEPYLLFAGDSENLRLHKPEGVEVHHASGAAAPQQRVDVVPGDRTNPGSHLLAGGGGEGLRSGESVWSEVQRSEQGRLSHVPGASLT